MGRREQLFRRGIDADVLAALEAELIDMRENNLRSEALLHLARALKAERWTKVLAAFCDMHMAWGWLPPGGDEIQREALTELTGISETKWGTPAAARIREAF